MPVPGQRGVKSNEPAIPIAAEGSVLPGGGQVLAAIVGGTKMAHPGRL